MRWLNAREWLEHERLTGLPTADLAADALAALHARDVLDDVMALLVEAELVEPDTQVDVCGLLRMFVPV